MHIPDGFVNGMTAVVFGGISAAGLGLALWRTKATMPGKRVPLMGLSAAFIFAAQMINFPVAGGTSGHLMGGVLASVMLGPGSGLIVMAAVLIAQALLFADGGLTALGANIFNMGLIGSVGGWVIYRGVSSVLSGVRGQIVGAMVGAWLTVVLAASSCSGQLAISGTAPWSRVFPMMAWVHMLIGVGEAIITGMVLVSVWRMRPELVSPQAEPAVRGRYWELAAYVLGISLGVAVLLSPLASSKPDGLDSTAKELGFKEKESEHRVVLAWAPEYKVPGIGSETVATSVAGAAGTAIVFVLALLAAKLMVPKKPVETSPPCKG